MSTFDPGLTVGTRRLVMRPFSRGDQDRIRAVVESGDEFLPAGAPRHVASVGQWLDHGVHELQRSGQGIHLAMEAEGRVIGSISLFRTHWGAGTTEVGYGVHPAHRGRGYAPEALAGLARHAFDEVGLRRIELRANVDNPSSIRVAEKSGFAREGVLRGAGFESDGPRDLVVFGLLAQDQPSGQVRRDRVLGPARLATARLLLRPFHAGDADDLLAVSADPDIRRWLKWPIGFTAERAWDFCVRLAHESPDTGVQWAVVATGTGRLSGAVSLFGADWDDGHAYCGYWIAPWARGHGFAAEATEAVVRHAFAAGLARVGLWAASGNTASQRVADRAGFTREGVLRGAGLLPGGVRTDMVVFGRLSEDPAPP
ncbi:hypothetical protein Misp01_59250 [Microtetraspora sp. NBRC 13810]|uniref:GNAT family N-acetyltransferase n=1 Tax=Microtetraspora sp. NBRC 13810 TaxID=3030990 RepID=UPI0024A3E48E|nr:GNAT family protein [Microtetraspora sp. NBRC 13810]GLW10797.1 hypothetical protein Misp01_59250 [Microtetraspora sp. NBRC 13810]